MKKRILVVEDDKGCIRAYDIYLKMIGDFDKTLVDSLKESEKDYLKKEFDYAILDGLKGGCFKLYEKINADKKIIITGDSNIFEKCKSKNIEAYLKPIRFGLFKEILGNENN